MDREQEFDQIKHFLNICKETLKLKKLLITGPKGSGKTSLINMIKLKENENYIIIDLQHVRISNNIVQILAECYETIEDWYLKDIGRYDLKIKNKKPLYLRDLHQEFDKLQEKINEKEQRPIILLCDDCNIIAENKTLPEINIFFKHLKGYNLIFCGTHDENIENIKKAFAPLMNITINNFDYKETKNAVYIPLNEKEKELVKSKDIRDIYLLACGRPCLVNLFCHYMYREYLESDNFGLTKNVYMNVLEQLPTLCLEADITDNIEILLRYKIDATCKEVMPEKFKNEFANDIDNKIRNKIGSLGIEIWESRKSEGIQTLSEEKNNDEFLPENKEKFMQIIEEIYPLNKIITNDDFPLEDKEVFIQMVGELYRDILIEISKEAENIMNNKLQEDIQIINSKDIENIIDNGKEWLKTDYKIESAWDASILVQSLIDAEENKKSSIISESMERIIMKTNRTSTNLWHSGFNNGIDKRDNVYDTSFAVIALIKYGDKSKSEIIQKAIDFIKGSVHPSGGWSTIPYSYEEIDVGATSWAIIALLKSGVVDTSSEIITKGVKWLKDNQNEDGGWGSWWKGNPKNTSLITKTYDATYALLEAGEYPKSQLIQKSINWLINIQQLVNEGEKNDQKWGWGWEQFKFENIYISDVENTATAVLTLLKGGVDPSHPVVETGINWLLKRKSTNGQWWDSDTPRVIMCLNEYLHQLRKLNEVQTNTVALRKTIGNM